LTVLSSAGSFNLTASGIGDFSAFPWDFEARIRFVDGFRWWQKLDGTAVVEGYYYAMKTLSANQGGGDNAKVTFAVAWVRRSRIGGSIRLIQNYESFQFVQGFSTA